MKFDKAMNYLLNGEKLYRKSWNGKEQYIQIGYIKEYFDADGNNIKLTNINHCIMFYGTCGLQCGWLASQGDMLSDDWYIKEV